MGYYICAYIEAFVVLDAGVVKIKLKREEEELDISLKDFDLIMCDSYLLKQYLKKNKYRRYCRYIESIDSCLCGKSHLDWRLVDDRIQKYPALFDSISILFMNDYLIFQDKRGEHGFSISYYGIYNLTTAAYRINLDIARIKGLYVNRRDDDDDDEKTLTSPSSDEEEDEEEWLGNKLDQIFESGQYNDEVSKEKVKKKIILEYERKILILRKLKNIL